MQLNKTNVKGKWNYFVTNWGLSDLVRKEISTIRHHNPVMLGFIDPIKQAPVRKTHSRIYSGREAHITNKI